MRLLYKVGVLEYGGGDVPERYDLTALLGDGALFIPGHELNSPVTLTASDFDRLVSGYPALLSPP